MNSDWFSIYLIAPLLAWFLAHTIKVVIELTKSNGKANWYTFFKSGDMPSGHSAVMVATVLVIGAREGVGSAIFGLAVVVGAIIIYDALNVRRAVGEQGEVLARIKDKVGIKQNFFIARGHTLLEVLGGVVVGLFSAAILLQFL